MPIVTTPGQQASRIQATTDPVPQTPPVQTSLPPIIPSTPITSAPLVEEEDRVTSVANSPFLDDDGDMGDSYASASAPVAAPRSQSTSSAMALSRMSEEDRRRIISSTFQLVLGREPSDRDFSYYRFSTLTEEGLTKSLLALPEHKQLVEKAREHTQLKQSVNELDLQVKHLDTSIQSMRQELQTLEYLLAEKNRYIQQMRGIPPERQVPLPAQPVAPSPQPAPAPQPSQQQSSAVEGVQTTTLPSPMDEAKSLFKGFFGKK